MKKMNSCYWSRTLQLKNCDVCQNALENSSQSAHPLAKQIVLNENHGMAQASLRRNFVPRVLSRHERVRHNLGNEVGQTIGFIYFLSQATCTAIFLIHYTHHRLFIAHLNNVNLVPRAFPLKNGWGGRRPWHRLVTCPLVHPKILGVIN